MWEKRIRKGFPSLLNYYNFVSEGVLLNKDGSLTAAFYYYGLDLDSMTQDERNALGVQVNTVFAKLDGSWSVNIDLLRVEVKRYPLTSFCTSPVARLIEHERKEYFEKEGTHYENIYSVTITFQPGLLQSSLFKKLFVNGDEPKGTQEKNMSALLFEFEKTLEKLEGGLSGCRLSLKRMSSEELFSFLHYCITGECQDGSRLIHQSISHPEFTESISQVLGGYDFVAGLKPSIDGKSICAVSVIGLPLESYSGMLDSMNTLSFPYRSSMRFTVLDPVVAQSLLVKVRTNWINKQFSFLTALMGLFSPGSESRFNNDDAIQKSDDADASLNESREGLVRYGFYTHTIILIGKDEQTNTQNANRLAQLLKNKGFPARVETFNAVESYLGSHPGNTNANIRKPLIHSFNYSHFIPLNSQWLGSEFNPNPKLPQLSPALFTASTTTKTPYFANIHVQDVGHHAILGATGYGKTTLQLFIILSFLRYRDAQIFAFDNNRGFFTMTKALGGDFYEILNEGESLSFCPLQGIDSDSEKLFCAGWLEELITLQGVQVTPKQRQAISEALDALRSDEIKSLSNFYANLQDRTLKSALDPFVSIQHGIMSKILDAEKDNLSTSYLQVFEAGALLNLESKYSLPVISYLFHKIETRLNGRPTLIVLSETWKLFNTPFFAAKINEWLRQCRAKNASVSFETHALTDIDGALKNVILANCLTKIFLPNPSARNSQQRDLYKLFGLNDGQIELIANAVPKRQYLFYSTEGSSLIDLQLLPVCLAFMGNSTKAQRELITKMQDQFGDFWPVKFLEAHRLNEHAQYLETLIGGSCHEPDR